MASELCMNCFSVKGQYETCPFCGYQEGTPPKQPHYLTPERFWVIILLLEHLSVLADLESPIAHMILRSVLLLRLKNFIR